MIGEKLQMILARCASKDVLDIGCVEHLSDFSDMESTQFAKLAGVASHIVGIDLDKRGVDAMKNIGFDVHCGFAEDAAELNIGPFEIIVLGDLIEHIPDPNAFLKSLAPLLKLDGQIICTTPNALCYSNPLFVIVNKKLTRHQHVCWYCRVTLENTFKLAGYQLSEMHYCSFTTTARNPLRRILDKMASFREELSPHLFGIFSRSDVDTRAMQKERLFS